MSSRPPRAGSQPLACFCRRGSSCILKLLHLGPSWGLENCLNCLPECHITRNSLLSSVHIILQIPRHLMAQACCLRLPASLPSLPLHTNPLPLQTVQPAVRLSQSSQQPLHGGCRLPQALSTPPSACFEVMERCLRHIPAGTATSHRRQEACTSQHDPNPTSSCATAASSRLMLAARSLKRLSSSGCSCMRCRAPEAATARYGGREALKQ